MSNESDESDKEESDRIESEPGPAGTFVTKLGGFLPGIGSNLGVTLSDDESCDGYRGSLDAS